MNEKLIEKNFKAGEGEDLVKLIRHHLRQEQNSKSHDPGAINEHRKAADNAIGTLLKKLAGRFQHYAWKCMGTKSQDDIDDAIREMTRRLLERVLDTSGTPGSLFFEQRFNLAVLGCMNDGVDYARGEYLDLDDELLKERKREKSENPDDETVGIDDFNADLFPLSLDAMSLQESEALEAAQADTASLQAVESLLTEEVYHQFLRTQKPEHRTLLIGWWNQKPTKELARELGVSEKTVRNRLAGLLEKLALQILGPDVVAQGKKWRDTDD